MNTKNQVRKWIHSPLGRLSEKMIWGIVTGSLLLLLFAKLAEDLLYDELKTFDTVVGNFVRSFATEGLTQIAVFITTIGSAYVEVPVMLGVGAVLFFYFKHTWEALVLTVSLAGGGLLNAILKAIFQRSRPDIQHLVEVGGYSFPSGHAMAAASFYGMLGYLLWSYIRSRSKAAGYMVIVLTLGLILAIGLSRIYLGVHFASDVVAGYAAGGAWLTACILGLHTIRFYWSDEKKDLD